MAARKGSVQGNGRVGIADVAKLAGCAPATVSRRLNDPGKVSDNVIRAIDAAIDQLGYVRNDFARVLRSNRSRLVGAIIPTLRHSIYAEMLAGLQQTLAKSGFALIYNTSDYDLEEEHVQARTLVERGVEAVVLVGTRHRAKTFELLRSRRVNCVVTYALQDDFSLTSFGFDNRRAAAIAADKLCDLGHRRFAMIAGVTHNNDRARGRVEGFLQALGARGIASEGVVVREAPYRIGDGRRAMVEILEQDPSVTAVFCGSDVLAIGALAECRQRGIAVPERISIVGFDNLEIAAYTDPPLSTLNVPAFEMGREAANYIIRSDPAQPSPSKFEFNVEFVERGTTARPPRDGGADRADTRPAPQPALPPSPDLVFLERPAAHVVRLTLNRPDKLNALSREMLAALAAALEQLARDEDVRCVIVTGAGRAFAAGADLQDMVERGVEAYRDADRVAAWRTIERFEKPLIAAVNGYALGGGCELMMLCDIVIAAESALIGQPEIKVGAFPGDGGTQRLPRIAGYHKAVQLILLGDPLPAVEAERINLVGEVVKDAELAARALAVATKLARRAPLAARAAKRLARLAAELPLADGLRAEHQATIEIFATDDRLEGQRAFLEKRRPRFQGK